MKELNPAPIANLPANYSEAKAALAKCERLDECKGWSDKAQALASYAKQAGDEELMNHARRIKARAVDRMGELISEIPAQPGKRTDLQPDGDIRTRLQAAAGAGVSKDQLVTAIRVNNVPRQDFERQVESDKPPTITALAKQGTKPAQPVFGEIAARDAALADKKAARDLLDFLNHIVNRIRTTDVERATRGMDDREKDLAGKWANRTCDWANAVLAAAKGAAPLGNGLAADMAPAPATPDPGVASFKAKVGREPVPGPAARALAAPPAALAEPKATAEHQSRKARRIAAKAIKKRDAANAARRAKRAAAKAGKSQ